MRDSRIIDAIAIIENSDAPVELSVENLARSMGLSTSRFAHLFSLHTGVTPARFIRETKLRKAARLLATTRVFVKDVARRAGFYDISHFVRDFRRCYGLSPSDFRTRAQDTARQ